jgi:GTP-binding protein
MSLEEALDFISTDELVEVTPLNFRMRKKLLSFGVRQRERGSKVRERVPSA